MARGGPSDKQQKQVERETTVFLLNRALLASHSHYFRAALRDGPARSRFAESQVSTFDFRGGSTVASISAEYDSGMGKEKQVAHEEREEDDDEGSAMPRDLPTEGTAPEEEAELFETSDFAQFARWLYACTQCKAPAPYKASHRCSAAQGCFGEPDEDSHHFQQELQPFELACAFADRFLAEGYERFALARLAQHAMVLDGELGEQEADEASGPAGEGSPGSSDNNLATSGPEESNSSSHSRLAWCVQATNPEARGWGRFIRAWVAWRRFNPAFGRTSPSSPWLSWGVGRVLGGVSLSPASSTPSRGVGVGGIDDDPILAAVQGWSSLDPRKYNIEHWFMACGEDLGVHCEHRAGLRPWAWGAPNSMVVGPRRPAGLIPRLLGTA